MLSELSDKAWASASLRPGLRVDAVLAQGSFGVVLRARQVAVGRDVAVKVLHAGFAPTGQPGRLFRDEIRAIGEIDHRNVVRVLDADHAADGRLYLVMELLEGPTLQQLADEGRMAPARAIHLIAQLLDGLAAAHAAGHIHADVKPSNVVVVEEAGKERVVLIDFGLSRLRRAGQPADAVGGTWAYMAPEQLRAWEVDARSDVFSAALVLVRLVTGWQRSSEDQLVPPLDAIDDPALRVALSRALALDPAARPSASDFARALRGGEPEEAPPMSPLPPFRELAALTERDGGRLYGRETDVIRLVRRLEAGRVVVFTAPSGTGKTSLLRAGLRPYLAAAGTSAVYVACEPGCEQAVIDAIAPGVGSLREAFAAWHAARARRLVVILDQLEAVLGGREGAALLEGLLDPEALPPGCDVLVLLSVREDFVARLLAATPSLADGVPQVRLAPLDRDGARGAIVEPLAEHGVEIESALLEALLDDLVRAGGDLGADLGWMDGPAIYPPHLQLAGSALFAALGPRETVLTLDHYQRLGGFDAVVGEHLERSLAQLSIEDRAVARDLFLGLVASAQTRAIRGEAELLELLGARHGEAAIRRVLSGLEARRLLARRAGFDGAPSWSLVHDTLVPRIEAWISVHDLDRRRVAEVVRFHLRQSQPAAPAVFSARQLDALGRHAGLLDELEAEWARRSGAVWTPRSLVTRSRQVLRHRRGVIGGGALAILALGALLVVSWLRDRREGAERAVLRDRDIGSFDLVLEPFDLVAGVRPGTLEPVPVDPSLLLHLSWQLHDPTSDDPESPGAPVAADRFRHGVVARTAAALREDGIAARGGDGYFVVTGRGQGAEACAPSIIPVRRLPGYAGAPTTRVTIQLRIPTCQATRAGTIEIPPGPFVFGGAGEPASGMSRESLPEERQIDLPAYRIDRTEVTNAAFDLFGSMSAVHDIWASAYPEVFRRASAPDFPRGDIDWFDARAFCRFLGKDIPTSQQWHKALRGGLRLPEGDNPMPRRNLPYGAPIAPAPVTIAPPSGCADSDQPCHPVAAEQNTADRSPYGVLALAGNLQEWVLDHEPGSEQLPASRRPRFTRGGNWFDTTAEHLVDYLAVENPRSPRFRSFYLGARCAESGVP